MPTTQRTYQANQSQEDPAAEVKTTEEARALVIGQLLEGAEVIRETAYQLHREILAAATRITNTLLAGGKVMLCGNGGSAADAQHIAAELIGRYRRERGAWPALALTTDTSILTAISNDYAYEQIFARQISALGREGDVLIALSTSGSSANVIRAAEEARARGIYVVGLTGERASPLATTADLCLQVPSAITSHIQQAHGAILHAVCELIDRALCLAEQQRQQQQA